MDDILEPLQESIVSHSQTLRLSVLRLFTSKAVAAPASTTEAFKRLLQGEQISLDVQGVRERVLRITRLGQALRDDDNIAADVSIRWLIGILILAVLSLNLY